MKQHFIMGTAGHVDHGKTTLIKALTGFDCDTHRQEKQRGITINLGFTHIDLDSDTKIGIVDVPGHKDFIHTMVAGASGIHFALFTIAADSGIMPQTVEHLKIMETLGISAGIIALTKVDLVDDEWLTVVKDDVRKLCRNTFLENAEIVPVSATTRQGIPELQQAIRRVLERVQLKPMDSSLFRMYIDRIYVKEGFGTIVNGSVLNGRLENSENVFLLPSSKTYRIRKMERFHEETDAVSYGDRASLNLMGFSRQDFAPGMLLSNRFIPDTVMIDVEMTLFPESPALESWMQGIFFVGTQRTQAKIHLLGETKLQSGQSGFVQMHLDNPCVMLAGDKFIFRNSSGTQTLGGGQILDAYPLHHRKPKASVICTLEQLKKGNLTDYIEYEVEKAYGVVTLAALAEQLFVSTEKIETHLRQYPFSKTQCYRTDKGVFLVSASKHQQLRSQILAVLNSLHKQKIIERKGFTVSEIRSKLNEKIALSFIELVLHDLAQADEIELMGQSWRLKDKEIELSKKQQKYVPLLTNLIQDSGRKVLTLTEIMGKIPLGWERNEKEIEKLLIYLINKGVVVHSEKFYLDTEVFKMAREKLHTYLKQHPEGITVAQFRDLIQGNRKLCLLLFGLFDEEGLTIRKEDVRVLRNA